LITNPSRNFLRDQPIPTSIVLLRDQLFSWLY